MSVVLSGKQENPRYRQFAAAEQRTGNKTEGLSY